MRKALLAFCVLIGIMYFSEKGFSFQDDGIFNKENEINKIENRLFELQRINKSVLDESEKLAEKIEKLKSMKNISIWHRYKLEDKLKQSKELSDRIKPLNRNIENVRSQYKKEFKEIIDLYNKKIKLSLKELKKQEEKSEKTLEEIGRLYDKRFAWKTKMEGEIFNSVILVEIEIDPLDGPNEIIEKADILMDLSEDLGQNLKVLKKRKEELKEEKDIRTEMGEFVKEISLFNELEEKRLGTPSLSKAAFGSISNETNNYSMNYYNNYWSNNTNESIRRDYLFKLFEEYEVFKDDKFSDESINNLMQKYDEIISKVEDKSSELIQKADIFYKKAEDLKKKENSYK